MGLSSDIPEPHKNEFLASASHELRTPLNAIVGMLELSLGEHLSLTLRDYLTTARDSAKALMLSLDQLDDLAQADVDGVDFACLPLDVGLVVRAALQPILQQAQRTRRELELRLPATLPADVCGDAKRIEQIFLPLVEHSFKSLEATKVVLEIRPTGISEHEVALEFDVSERGLGTAAERQHYQAFVPQKSEKYSTAGLGLTIAERWLKELQGQLWTHGTQQTRFYGVLTMPRSPEALAAAKDAKGSTPRETAMAAGGRIATDSFPQSRPARPLHVLVADDTPANQKVVKAVLTKRGHRVELADNGRHAVEELQRQSFDVVLMDAQMPMMNGLQATAAIRDLSDSARSRVPIIALTAHTLQEDRRRCLAAGMDDYLSKPIDVAALINCVEFHGNAGRPKGEMQMQQQPQAAPMAVAQDFLAGALARLGGDEHLLRELIRLFQQDAGHLLQRIQQGIEANDADSAGRAAHNLRGLAANFDDTPTISAAGGIERAAGEANWDEATRQLPELESALERLLAALTEYIERSSDA